MARVVSGTHAHGLAALAVLQATSCAARSIRSCRGSPAAALTGGCASTTPCSEQENEAADVEVDQLEGSAT